jgi:hypothetical protein
MTTFTTIAQIEQAPTKELIEFYNSVNPEKPVKKFADRQTALKRCIALLAEIEQAGQNVEHEEMLQAEDEQTAKVRSDLKEAHAEHAAEGGEALESEEAPAADEEKPKHKWPFAVRGENPSLVDAPKTDEKPVKRATVGHASNSAGVAASWANAAVAEARLTRDGVTVTVNGKTTEHRSTREAFRHYRLLDSKHIRFRGKLKEAREAVYNENGVDYLFKIAQIAV